MTTPLPSRDYYRIVGLRRLEGSSASYNRSRAKSYGREDSSTSNQHAEGLLIGILVALLVMLAFVSCFAQRHIKERQRTAEREQNRVKEERRDAVIEIFETAKTILEIHYLKPMMDEKEQGLHLRAAPNIQPPKPYLMQQCKSFIARRSLTIANNLGGTTRSSSSVTDGVTNNADASSSIITISSGSSFVEEKRSCPNMRTIITDVCAICLDNFEDGQQIAWSPNDACSHTYHKACIVEYALLVNYGKNGKVPCPTCRECFVVVPSLLRENQVGNSSASVEQEETVLHDVLHGDSEDAGPESLASEA